MKKNQKISQSVGRSFSRAVLAFAVAAALSPERVVSADSKDNATLDADTSVQLAASRAVEPELARFVAADRVTKYYPGLWTHINQFVYYDFDGIPVAYAFVFSKEGSSIRTAVDLELHLAKAEARREQARKSPREVVHGKSPSDQDSAAESAQQSLYGFEDLATVVTGAVEDSPLVLAHHRGLPGVIAERLRMEGSLKRDAAGNSATLGRILQLNSFDQRYTITTGNASKETAGLPAAPRPSARAFVEGTRTVCPQSGETSSLNTLKAQAELREGARKRAMEQMEEPKRREFEKAKGERNALNQRRWDGFRERLLQARTAGR